MEFDTQVVELRVSYRYAKQHPWVIQAITGFLSAYFMEQPGFRVQRHFNELESGMYVWRCEVPADTTMHRLVRRLKADVPPFRLTEVAAIADRPPHHVIDSPEPPSLG